VHAARAGDELAFQRLLRRHQPLLDAHARRYFLPGADHDDILQEARIAFAKAVWSYRPDAGASFRTFAALCVTRQLASALTAARRHKHLALSEASRGDDAERAWELLPDRADGPAERVLARERRDELRAAGASLSALSWAPGLQREAAEGRTWSSPQARIPWPLHADDRLRAATVGADPGVARGHADTGAFGGADRFITCSRPGTQPTHMS
jgi:RNA polymerase sigma factor (sigma-70 family)